MLHAGDPIASAIHFRALVGEQRVAAIWWGDRMGMRRLAMALHSHLYGRRHMYIQLPGTLCLLGGFAAIYYNKMLQNRSHFQSLHGKV